MTPTFIALAASVAAATVIVILLIGELSDLSMQIQVVSILRLYR